MIKLVLFVASAIPIFVFLKAVLFKRSTALKAASSEFEKNVGYLATVIVGIAGLAIVYAAVRALIGK